MLHGFFERGNLFIVFLVFFLSPIKKIAKVILFLSGSSSGENSYQDRKKTFFNWSAKTGACVIDGGGGRLLLLVWFFAERSRINTSNESLKKWVILVHISLIHLWGVCCDYNGGFSKSINTEQNLSSESNKQKWVKNPPLCAHGCRGCRGPLLTL